MTKGRRSPSRTAAATNLSANLRAFRSAHDLSLHDLGRMIGVSAVTVFYWESGVHYPKAAHLQQIAQLLAARNEAGSDGPHRASTAWDTIGDLSSNQLQRALLTARLLVARAAGLPEESIIIQMAER